MKEANIQTELAKHHNLHGVFELKLCKGRSISFDSVAEHQVEGLLKAKTDGKYHKISDSMIFDKNKGSRFPSKKPFDFFYLKDTPAYVVICFYEPRKKKLCYYIDIDKWLEALARSPKKSIREEEVKEIASHVLCLKKKEYINLS